MTHQIELENCRAELAQMRTRVATLESENSFLKMHPVFVQGLKGETLVAEVTEGRLTSFAAQHDITLGSKITIEVKFSKLNVPNLGSPTRRWNWSKPLGYKDKGKSYDFLVLIGDKDLRFPDQYVDDSPYVYFLIPKGDVPSTLTRGATMGSNCQLTSNLTNAKSPSSVAIKKHMVPLNQIAPLLAHAAPMKD